MSRNDGLSFVPQGGQNGREQVGEGFAYPGACFDDHGAFFFKGLAYLHSHALLFFPVFKVRGFGEQSGGRKGLMHLSCQAGECIRRGRAGARPAVGHVFHQFLRQPAFHKLPEHPGEVASIAGKR